MKKVKFYGDKVVDVDEEYGIARSAKVVDAIEKTLRLSKEHADATIKNESEETKQKKKTTQDKKQQAIERKRALEEEFAKTETLVASILKMAKEEGVQAAMNEFSKKLENYKADSNELDEKMKEFGLDGVSNRYVKLFETLCKENIEFLPYAPDALFERDLATILNKAAKTDKAILKKIQKNLEKADYFSTNKINIKNLKFFPDYISQITEHTDAMFALSLDYTKFKNLHTKILQNLRANTNLMSDMITRVPETLQYLTKEDVAAVYNYKNSAIGYAIYNYPKNLDSLESNFFAKHKPKYVFSNYSKAKLIDRFEGVDIARFPELVAHLGINVDGGYGV